MALLRASQGNVVTSNHLMHTAIILFFGLGIFAFVFAGFSKFLSNEAERRLAQRSGVDRDVQYIPRDWDSVCNIQFNPLFQVRSNGGYSSHDDFS